MPDTPTTVCPEPLDCLAGARESLVEGLSLVCHPDTPAHGVEGIEVHAERHTDGTLRLRYHIEVPENDLMLSDPAAPARTDGLWQTTCCELFIARSDVPAYLEFNFSPSGQWAAYQFSNYRAGQQNLDILAPGIFIDCSASHFAVEVVTDLPPEWSDTPLTLALSAVIEESDGTKSYWALRHPPGKPDFHHPDCFQLTLGAPPPA